MVQLCRVPNCPSKYRNCRLYAVPYTNKERWSKWTNKCPNLLDYEPRRRDMLRICRRHFSSMDIWIANNGKENLKGTAVPHLNLELKPNGLPIHPEAEDWLWDKIGGHAKQLSAPFRGCYHHEMYATKLRQLYLAECQQLGEVAVGIDNDVNVCSSPKDPQLQGTYNQPEQDSDTEIKDECEETFVEESYTDTKESEEITFPKFSWEDTEAVIVIDDVDLEQDDNPEVKEEICGECGGDASGLQWWCVNRGVRACAMCCAQDPAGYWLRVPDDRPRTEVEDLVSALRLQLSPAKVKMEPVDDVEELCDAVALPFGDPLAEDREAPPVPAGADDEELGSETELDPRPEQVVPAQQLVVTGKRRQVAIQVAAAPVVPRKRKASPTPMDITTTSSTTRIPIMPLPMKTSRSAIPIYLHTPAQTNISSLQMKSSPTFVASRLPSTARRVLYLPSTSFLTRLPTTRLVPATPISTFRPPTSLHTPVLTLPLNIPPPISKKVATQAPPVGIMKHLADHLYAGR